MHDIPFDSSVGKMCWKMDKIPTPVLLGFPCGSAGKESACNARHLSLIPGLERSPWKRERLPIPLFWPRKFHGLYSPWGHKESDTTEQLSLSHRTKGNHVKRIESTMNINKDIEMIKKEPNRKSEIVQ